MAGFYKELPTKFKWAGVRIMPWRNAKEMFPPRNLFFWKRGKYFQVQRNREIVVKTARTSKPFLDANYQENDLTSHVRSQITAAEIENLRASVQGLNTTVMDAYIRAKVELLSFERLCKSVRYEFLVEQTVLLTWGRWGRDSRLDVLLLQPYVRGMTIRAMFPFRYSIFRHRDRALTLREGFTRLIPEIGSQLRLLIESHYVDVNPRNFIFTDDGRLVYVDYHPPFPQSRKQGMDDFQMHFRSYYRRFDEMLKSWGY